MKIVQLDIEGFRSLKNVSWRPGDLNVIIGPNGSGKSNLLRMLELISASAQSQLTNYIQAAGGMASVVWDGRAKKVSFVLRTSPLDEMPESQRHELTYQAELVRVGSGSAYIIDSEMLADYHLVELNEKRDPFKYLDRHGLSSKIFDEQKRNLVDPEVSLAPGETLLAQAANPFINNKGIILFQKQLVSWGIYEDVSVNRDAPIRQPAVTRLERRLAPDGQNLVNVLHTLHAGDREFKQQVNSSMLVAFGDDFEELSFQPDFGDQRIQMKIRWKSLKRDTSVADVSDGTLRFLFLIAVLANPNPPSLIAIDEPETGLHPSMLPIIAELAVNAAERTQVVFTTHSDQFLDAFRETGVTPTTTVTRWENGETTLTTLSDEDLAYWLKDYSLGKMFRTGELENLAA